MQIIFLGTSGMVPTKERNVAGVFLSYKDDGILFDCGEGTQRQMNIAGIKRNAVTKILISHWHGDHVAGIIVLIQ
ncbi:MBL fold metallo-hydrolase, partial [Candidatus Woesearchaeota archaeon]|nr:MBL fold metallo-hydrolase [Candidatus Woesearchaeota archaeon]